MVFNSSMCSWNCNNFSCLEIIADRKNNEYYQLIDHDWGKTFGRVKFNQIKYNYNANFVTFSMFLKSAVLQNSELLLIIRN